MSHNSKFDLNNNFHDLISVLFFSVVVKLFPEHAPQSIDHILELLALKRCAGCHFYRAESRGKFWDSEGNHVKNVRFFHLIQIWEHKAFGMHKLEYFKI